MTHKVGQAGADSEIVVTPEMIEAGLTVLYRAQRNDVMAQDYIGEVFVAMALASDQIALKDFKPASDVDNCGGQLGAPLV